MSFAICIAALLAGSVSDAAICDMDDLEHLIFLPGKSYLLDSSFFQNDYSDQALCISRSNQILARVDSAVIAFALQEYDRSYFLANSTIEEDSADGEAVSQAHRLLGLYWLGRAGEFIPSEPVENRDSLYELAIQHYEQIDPVYDPDREYLASVAIIQATRRKFHDASKSIGEYLEFHPDAGWAWNWRADFATLTLSFTEALEYTDSAIANGYSPAEVWNDKAELSYIASAWEETIIAADSALARDPQQPLMYRYRGSALLELNRLEPAKQDLKHCLLLEPTDATALDELLRIAEHEGNREDVGEILGRKLSVDDSDYRDWVKYAGVLLELSKYQIALPVAIRATEQFPDCVSCFQVLGAVYRVGNELDSAETVYKRALDLDPKSASSYFWLAGIKLIQEDLDQAIEYFEKSIEIDSTQATSWSWLGVASEQSGNDSAALAFYRRAVEIDGADLYSWFRIGDYYFRHQDYDNASACYESIVGGNKSNTEAWVKLSLSRFLSGHYEEALNACDKAIELAPDREDLKRQRKEIMQKL